MSLRMSVGLEANEARTQAYGYHGCVGNSGCAWIENYRRKLLKITGGVRGADGIGTGGESAGDGVGGISAAPDAGGARDVSPVSGPRCRFGRPPLLIDPEVSPVHSQSTRTRRPKSQSAKKFLIISVCIQLLPAPGFT